MATFKEKVENFKSIFGKRQLGLNVYYGTQNQDDFLNNKVEFIELKIMEAQQTFSKSISDLPLENTKIVTDNVKIEPKQVNIQVLLNDYSGAGITNLLTDTFKKPEVRNTLFLFDNLRENSYFCDVITLTRKYTRMQLVEYSYTENVNGADKYIIVDLSFQEVITFEIEDLGIKKRKANVSTITAEPESLLEKFTNKYF